MDTHDDTTQRFIDGKFDLGHAHWDGSIDIPRMREGSLTAIFFSIWIPSKVTGPEAVKRALDQIDAVREQVKRIPSSLYWRRLRAMSRTAKKNGKLAALMGVEGGHMIGNDLGVLHRLRLGCAVYDADAQRQ